MHNLLKNSLIFLFIIIFIIAFSSSYASLSIDNLAYVLAIGIDTASEDDLEVTFQFSTTFSPSESGPTEKASPVTNSIKASSLSNAINLMNSRMGKEINMSHCKVIIFSEELASKGISDEIYTLTNDTQIRPSANIIISKCDAKSYIKQTNPELENSISKYYEIMTNSSKYTGHIPDSTIADFFNALVSNTCEPYAILGENGSNNIGIAVFKDDKLVGELDSTETISFMCIKNDVNRFLISVPDPINEGKYLDIYFTPYNSPSIDIETIPSSPYIKIKMRFAGRIYSMSENSNYLTPEVLEEISSNCNSYLESSFSNLLYKTSKELNSDIQDFGKHALSKFITTKDFNHYDWQKNYKNAFFDVDIDCSVKSGMLITET